MAPSILTVRINRSNPNHHLWNNNGTWFIHYILSCSDGKKERIRESLETKSVDEARRLRDEFFAQQVTSRKRRTA